MHARQTTLAKLAEAFGTCLHASTTLDSGQGQIELPGEKKRERLRRIARVMDHLSTQPDSLQWHRRVARVHQEISAILGHHPRRVRSGSLWAEA